MQRITFSILSCTAPHLQPNLWYLCATIIISEGEEQLQKTMALIANNAHTKILVNSKVAWT